jgi:hypothetical protein
MSSCVALLADRRGRVGFPSAESNCRPHANTFGGRSTGRRLSRVFSYGLPCRTPHSHRALQHRARATRKPRSVASASAQAAVSTSASHAF